MQAVQGLVWLLAAALPAVLACSGENPSGTSLITLEITVATAGEEPDSDGYTIQVDDQPSRPVGTTDVFQGRDIGPGEHRVFVGGIAENCRVEGANPRSVTVEPEGITTITIQVSCMARRGQILVSVRTQGPAPDPHGLTIVVDGIQHTAVDTGIVVLRDQTRGSHVISLQGIASNCSAQGNPRTISVRPLETTLVEFTVLCVGLHGTLSIETETLGPGPDQFRYRIDEGRTEVIGSGGSHAVVTSSGPHLVELLGIPSNCSVLGPNPSPVDIPAGGRATVKFEVQCT